jgi:hypothetical protein
MLGFIITASKRPGEITLRQQYLSPKKPVQESCESESEAHVGELHGSNEIEQVRNPKSS